MGKIILLNTPIGNLGDITTRVFEALKAGELFAVEDTRAFKDLLNLLEISVAGKKIYSLHDQSEPTYVERLLDMAERETLYVASEAGSPIISDPAYPIVIGAYQRGIKVESYSGVSSPIMALELSGLPPIPFTFHGFLPRESGKRKKFFQNSLAGTHIFFEAPTRVVDTLDDLSEIRPNAQICVLRELSKKFEQVLKFRGEEWGNIKMNLVLKGEFVVVFHHQVNQKQASLETHNLAVNILEKGPSPKLVAKLVADLLDRPTKEIYSKLISKK